MRMRARHLFCSCERRRPDCSHIPSASLSSRSYLGMRSSKQQEIGAAECPSGEGTSGIKVYRGFVEWGDKDLYEYELNCKSIAANLASIRGLPDLKMLGLSRNVLTWDTEQLGTWLDALGLGELVPNFEAHHVDGGTVFLLTGIRTPSPRSYCHTATTPLQPTQAPLSCFPMLVPSSLALVQRITSRSSASTSSETAYTLWSC
jgi:hypothetical protein